MKETAVFWRRTDAALWLSVCAAVLFGCLLIASMQRSGDYNYLRPQLAAAAAGLALAVLLGKVDYRCLADRWYIAAGAALLLTAAVFLFGMRVSGTDDTAWLVLPLGLTVQPSEFVKLCFILTFAKHLSVLRGKNALRRPWGVMSLAAHVLLPVAAIHLQGDDGAALIFLLMAAAMASAAGIPRRCFAVLGGGLLAGLPLLWAFFLNGEQRSRLSALFDPDGSAMTNYGWQQYQAKLSLACGELYGSGLFHGARVGCGIVPEQENDFILTVAGEELGFFGCLPILLLLLWILLRILRAMRLTRDFCGRCVCCGVFALIASQAVINLGMVLGFLPVIGVTLPFFSAGGSSLLSVLAAVGLAQSVNYHNDTDLHTARLRQAKNRIRL